MGNPSTDPFDAARVEAMVRGYHERWSADMAQYRVLAVEAEFRAPLRSPETGAPSRTWRLGGKLDVLIEDLSERCRLVVEHKSATADIKPGSDYMKRLRLDGQVSVYYEGANAFGVPVDGCLYDVLGKPKLRPLKATPVESRKFTKAGALYKDQRLEDETPEEFLLRCVEAIAADPAAYYQRAKVVRLEQEMKDAMADVWDLGRIMRESHLAGRAPRNPDACVRYGRTCEYFPVCTGEASLDDARLYRRSEVIHPELADDNADLALLSASRLASFRACPRLHHFRYVQGIRPVEDAEALRFGSLMHLALEAWWRAPEGERLEAALAALNPSAAPAAYEAAVSP